MIEKWGLVIENGTWDMSKVGSNCLTERHLQLFGTIVQWFARYELLMQEIMASAAGCDSGSIIVLTRNLDFGEKRQILFDLLRYRNIPQDRYDRINTYLMVPHTLTRIRNHIAHSAWIPGPSSNSIQPDFILGLPRTVKPFHGEGIIEAAPDKVAYSLEDLTEAAATLASNYERVTDYLREVGYIRKIPQS